MPMKASAKFEVESNSLSSVPGRGGRRRRDLYFGLDEDVPEGVVGVEVADFFSWREEDIGSRRKEWGSFKIMVDNIFCPLDGRLARVEERARVRVETELALVIVKVAGKGRLGG